MMAKDNRWLQVEVCREFMRQSCSRSEDECRFAHPPPNIDVVNGRVVACYDFMKGRCHRDSCRYLHPPRRIKKDQLESAGKNHPLTLPASGSSQFQAPHHVLPTQWPVPFLSAATPGTAAAAVVAAAAPAGPVVVSSSGRRADKSDRLEACREFLRGTCNRSETDCRFAHPPEHISVDSSDNTVTVCMDFMKDRCSRDTCRYFHPPPHLQQRVRQQQQQHQATISSSGSNSVASPVSSAMNGNQISEQVFLANGLERLDLQATAPGPVLPSVVGEPMPYHNGTHVPSHAMLPVQLPGNGQMPVHPVLPIGQLPVAHVPVQGGAPAVVAAAAAAAAMAAATGGLASAVNTNVDAMAQQPSVLQYQQMLFSQQQQTKPASEPWGGGHIEPFTFGRLNPPPLAGGGLHLGHAATADM